MIFLALIQLPSVVVLVIMRYKSYIYPLNNDLHNKPKKALLVYDHLQITGQTDGKTAIFIPFCNYGIYVGFDIQDYRFYRFVISMKTQSLKQKKKKKSTLHK